MKKAVLVMDMPEGCQECGFCRCDGDRCLLLNVDIPERVYMNEERLSDCLLHELPEKKDITPLGAESYISGWNDCLDTISIWRT